MHQWPNTLVLRIKVCFPHKGESSLNSMLLVKENHVRMRGNASEGHMLYLNSNGGMGHGRGKTGRLGQG